MSAKDATSIVPYVGAFGADVLSAFAIPGGSILSSLAVSYAEKRREEAAELVINEIRNGYHGEINFDDYDVDPMLEITMRLNKAVNEGTARENLRLLAQVIAGQKKYGTLNPDQFRRWCGVLENLSRDELLMIGKAYVISRTSKDKTSFWQSLEAAMQEDGFHIEVIRALASSITRTGLLAPHPVIGGTAYHYTPWLGELGKLADLDVRTNGAVQT